ncbi:response regulator [Pseudobacteriovorax antillogorgiicola]|uniref:Response regulator receiver domain-containing protein n=1 Tax=Pseudobacteriovorax antillogorgiicola TaxID=1513793 RepID=A0A1Y6CLT4_9BACT|nr:response regulator [Pseudobacteriovorax antillogorgiicola]TCS47343.1 response regulator receiver domain-containing protein [Pseudobacteriovorax antillogorgiicola]SMF63168.1 Response regulator receiver domain-containing protein [Pseudobacteriovorax antillogorgiicola]
MKTILIVDDVKEMRDLLNKIVTKMGYQALEAATGQEALKLLDESPKIEVVLLDMGLPDIDGLEVATSIRKKDESMKICFITGKGDYEYVKAAGKVGAVSYIVKPIRPSLVIERLKQIVA